MRATSGRRGTLDKPTESATDTLATENATQRGVDLLKQGRYTEACHAFRETLAGNPSAEAHVNVAYALQQLEQPQEAIEHLTLAVALDPQLFDAQYMLGLALEQAGRFDGAIPALSAAVSLKKDFEQGHADLCRVLSLTGDTSAAHAAIDMALMLHPSNADFHFFKGNVYLSEHDLTAATTCYGAALERDPKHLQAWINQGIALHRASRLPDAEVSLQMALSLDPESGLANLRLGQILRASDRWTAATNALRKAAASIPNNGDVWNELGIAYQASGQLDDAVSAFRQAIVLEPTMPGGYANLGLALFDRGDLEEALHVYRQGLARGSIAEMHDNYAIALQAIGDIEQAFEHYRLALQLQPGNLNTQCNLAAALAEDGRAGEAIGAYRQILRDNPKHTVAHSNLLFNLSVDTRTSPRAYLEQAVAYNAALADSAPLPSFTHQPDRGKALRVGFVSGDFRDHPVGYFLEGILPVLKRNGVELFAYPTIAQEDKLTRRIKSSFATWRPLKGLSDPEAAIAIRADRLNILVDLSGHTGHNRLPIFSFRAAPVQVSWLGFFASTGLKAMDYLISDDLSVPAGADRNFSEKIWRLPQTRLCFTAPDEATAREVAPPPLLKNRFVTFGSFQRPSKLTDEVLRLWGKVLVGLPGARLLLQNQMTGRTAYVEHLKRRLESHGLNPAQVDIKPPALRAAYLSSYDQVDMVLDTFPYTGGTTTCEALWMGVPTLTMMGESMISRQGAALLSAAGMPEWIARSVDDFVDKAHVLSRDAIGLQTLRLSTRDRLTKSALLDVDLFATRLQSAFEEMWERYLTSAEAERTEAT